MSASLVGSEMCIRDSAKRSSEEVKGSKMKELARTYQQYIKAKFDNVKTVSYTHLTLPTICSV
eukprot:9962607-Alexandrium_andersonii.AAC.1